MESSITAPVSPTNRAGIFGMEEESTKNCEEDVSERENIDEKRITANWKPSPKREMDVPVPIASTKARRSGSRSPKMSPRGISPFPVDGFPGPKLCISPKMSVDKKYGRVGTWEDIGNIRVEEKENSQNSPGLKKSINSSIPESGEVGQEVYKTPLRRGGIGIMHAESMEVAHPILDHLPQTRASLPGTGIGGYRMHPPQRGETAGGGHMGHMGHMGHIPYIYPPPSIIAPMHYPPPPSDPFIASMSYDLHPQHTRGVTMGDSSFTMIGNQLRPARPPHHIRTNSVDEGGAVARRLFDDSPKSIRDIKRVFSPHKLLDGGGGPLNSGRKKMMLNYAIEKRNHNNEWNILLVSPAKNGRLPPRVNTGTNIINTTNINTTNIIPQLPKPAYP